MTTPLIIEEDRGTYTARARRHNGYYGGDFSSHPVLNPRDLLAQLGASPGPRGLGLARTPATGKAGSATVQ